MCVWEWISSAEKGKWVSVHLLQYFSLFFPFFLQKLLWSLPNSQLTLRMIFVRKIRKVDGGNTQQNGFMSELPIALASSTDQFIKHIEGDEAMLLPYTNMYINILQLCNLESGNTPHEFLLQNAKIEQMYSQNSTVADTSVGLRL